MKLASVFLLLAVTPQCGQAFSVVSSGPLTTTPTLSRKLTAVRLLPVDQMVDAVVASAAAAVSQSGENANNLMLSPFLVSLDISAPPETAGISYSKASYYTVLGLYLMSFPGIWSTVKRSTTAKIKRKTYVSAGEKSVDEKAMSLRQQAGEIMACKLFLFCEQVERRTRNCFRRPIDATTPFAHHHCILSCMRRYSCAQI